jgi:tetratricopeptide (TPR) repeat protein
LDPKHRDLGYAVENLGLSLADQGHHKLAVEHLERALEIWSASMTDDHPDLGTGHLNLANSLLALGRLDDARDHYRAASTIWETAYPVDHPVFAYALTGLGRIQLAQGRTDEAVAALERAYELRNDDQEDPLNLAETSLMLARALWAQGHDPDRAVQLVVFARDSVGAYQPTDTIGLRRVLMGEEVPRFTDQLAPPGLGTSNLGRRIR